MKLIKRNVMWIFTLTGILCFLGFIPVKAAGDDAQNIQFQHNENVIYESFLNNQRSAIVSEEYCGHDIYTVEKGGKINLAGIIAGLKNQHYSCSANPTVSYQYVNFGKDDVWEMKVIISDVNIYSPNDSSYVVYILRTEGNELYITYSYSVWDRSYTDFNEFDVYKNYGVEYAGDKCMDNVGCIDNKGIYRDLFAKNSYSYDCLDKIDDSFWKKVDTSEIKGSVRIVKYIIGETSFCYWEPAYEGSQINITALNEYMQKWTEYGIIWCTQEQAEAIMNEYLAKYQLNLEMVNY